MPAMSGPHPVMAILRDAASGRFPPADRTLQFLPSTGPADGVVAFTGHNLIATDIDPNKVLRHLPNDDPGAPMHPSFLAWLATELASGGYTPDLVLVAVTKGAEPRIELTPRTDLDAHPRVALSLRYRSEVRVLSDPQNRGIVLLRTGVAGRKEVAIEIDEAHRGKGLGRILAEAARAFVEDELLFAQVSPGNVASLRAFLAAGYTPICSEVWFGRNPKTES
jgi:RimJ/RimL family protein N-acetyltransferase